MTDRFGKPSRNGVPVVQIDTFAGIEDFRESFRRKNLLARLKPANYAALSGPFSEKIENFTA